MPEAFPPRETQRTFLMLNVPKSGALDFVSLGALIHRLDPGIIPFRKATNFDVSRQRW